MNIMVILLELIITSAILMLIAKIMFNSSLVYEKTYYKPLKGKVMYRKNEAVALFVIGYVIFCVCILMVLFNLLGY